MAAYQQLREHDLEQDESSMNGSNTDTDALLEKQAFYQPGQKCPRTFSVYFWAHVLAFVANLTFFLMLWHKIGEQNPFHGRLVFSPAQDAIQYVSQQWDHTNIYFRNGSVNPARTHKGFGPPSEESDQAWEELLQYQNIRLKKDELGELRDVPDLVKFTDGSGTYATLSAYHSLHCIKRLHHHMYLEHYYPNTTDLEKMLITHHAGKYHAVGWQHCLNILLQSVKCNADLSIIPMEWGATTRIPIGLDEGHHHCVQWEGIDGWMKERSVDVFEPGLVVHPTLGEAYPGGEGDEIGIALDHLLGEHGHAESSSSVDQ